MGRDHIHHKEEAQEINVLAGHEFEKAYDSASNIAKNVMQAEGIKMDKFLEHFGGKLFK